MLSEHDGERALVKDLVQGIDEYNRGEEKAARKIIGNIQDIIFLLTPHIDKEDHILYPMAEIHLSDKEQDRLFAEFTKIEKKKIGLGKHEQFHNMLHRLEKIYLRGS